MTKIINYIGVGLSIILMVMSFYYIDEVEKSKDVAPLLALFINDSVQLTKQVGVYSLFIFIFFLLLLIKNYTNQKKMSMIGIGLTILIIIWDLTCIIHTA